MMPAGYSRRSVLSKVSWENRLLSDHPVLVFAFRLPLTCFYNIGTNFEDLNFWPGAQTTGEKWSGQKVQCYCFPLAGDRALSHH